MSSALARALLLSLGQSEAELEQLEKSEPTQAAELAAEVLNHQVSIPAAVRRVIAALLLGQLERKDANTILFALQTLLISERNSPCSSPTKAANAASKQLPASTSTRGAEGVVISADSTATSRTTQTQQRGTAYSAHSAKVAAGAQPISTRRKKRSHEQTHRSE